MVAIGRVAVQINCDLRVTPAGGINIHTEEINPEWSEKLAIAILIARGWNIERIGTQTRAYAPEPESKQYPSKDIKPEE